MSEEQNERLSLPEKAQNLAKFSWDLIKYLHSTEGSRLTVSDEIYKERITICRNCPKFLEMQNECSECGCYLPMKARMGMDSCPLGKWTDNSEGWEETFNDILKELDKDSKTE